MALPMVDVMDSLILSFILTPNQNEKLVREVTSEEKEEAISNMQRDKASDLDRYPIFSF